MGLWGPAHPSLLRAVPAYAGDERFEGHCGNISLEANGTGLTNFAAHGALIMINEEVNDYG